MTRKEHDIIYRLGGAGATGRNGAAPHTEGPAEETTTGPASADVPSGALGPAGLPPVVATAIAEVMARVKSLPRTERNDHAGHMFANIDAFPAAVGPLCAEAGLIVLQDEEAAELVDLGGRAWLRLVHAFHLAHRSGALRERPLRRTVLHRMDGAQAFGSAQSYAPRQPLLALFQIPTGDREDADYQPREDVPGAAPPERRPDRPAASDPRPRRGAGAPGGARGHVPGGPVTQVRDHMARSRPSGGIPGPAHRVGDMAACDGRINRQGAGRIQLFSTPENGIGKENILAEPRT
jgi:hypothetical protein